jgi:two-component system response regulator CpxR
MRDRPILIVDDDLDIREVLAETLAEEGFDVVTATNGLEAIQVIRSMKPPPSIILLDLMMPIMDGYGFLEQRDKDAQLASIPIAIITAGRGVDRSRLGSGAVIIPKPIDLPTLVGVLHRHLGSGPENPA